jgi:RNA polymerase sigma-70 factor (ECF subfamily)
MNEDLILKLLLRSYEGDSKAYLEILTWLEAHSFTQLKSGLRAYGNFPTELKQDIVQEVLITFHQVHRTFDTSRAFYPWINSLIRHKTIDFIRRKDFRVHMSGVDLELIKDSWEADPDPDPVESRDTLGLLKELPSKQAEILRLSKMEGYSNKEIASELRMTESNVKVSMFRALKVLKKISSDRSK